MLLLTPFLVVQQVARSVQPIDHVQEPMGPFKCSFWGRGHNSLEVAAEIGDVIRHDVLHRPRPDKAAQAIHQRHLRVDIHNVHFDPVHLM